MYIRLANLSAIAVLSIASALLVLASSTPLTMPGWGQDTFWGELLASYWGIVLFAALALGGVAAALCSKQWVLLLLTIPLAALMIMRPDTVSLDEGVLNSFMQADVLLEVAQQGRNPEALRLILERIRAGEGAVELTAPAADRLQVSSWFMPENYAIRARIDRWNATGAPQATEIIRSPFFEVVDLEEIRTAIRNLQEAEFNSFRCISQDLERVRPSDRFMLSPFGNCPPPADFSEQIAEFQQRLVAAESLETSNSRLASQAEHEGHAVLGTIALFEAAEHRLETWRAGLAIAMAVALSVVICALVLRDGYLFPFVSGGFLLVGLAGQSVVPSLALIDVAPRSFVALHALFLLAVFLSARVVRLFVLQNRDIWVIFQPRQRLGILMRTSGWWSVLALFTVLGVWLNVQATRLVDRTAYAMPLHGAGTDTETSGNDWLCQNPHQTLIFAAGLESRQLEADIDNSVRCHFRDAAEMIADAGVASEIADALGNVEQIASAAFDRVVPSSLPCHADGQSRRPHCITEALNYPSCDWYQFLCRIRSIPHRMAERAYSDTRAKSRARFLARVNVIAEDTINSSASAEASIAPALAEAVLQMGLEVRNALAASFRSWDIVNAIGAILFTMAVIKSFGFVLARIVYDRVLGENMRFPDKAPEIAPSTVEFGNDAGKTVDGPGRYYVRSDAELSSLSPSGPWPWKFWKFPFARFPRLTFLGRFSFVEGERSILFSGINSQEFAKLELVEGQNVAFALNRLLAFSDTMTMKRVWSFRLSHLVLGRASMIVARGPGNLYLRSFGEIRSGDADRDDRFSPSRLLAWEPNQSFEVHSTVSFESMYMGGITVGGQAKAMTLFDAKGQRSGFGGALKFVPLLLLPF